MSFIKNLVKEEKSDESPDSEPKDDGKPRRLIKSATDLQRLKLEKLMKNPDKPIIIPDSGREKDYLQSVPTFVRNVMGSSAGAGSGEFHVYRHLRRKEYARQKNIQAKSMREQLDDDYQKKLEDNRRKAEEKTAKKRAKRLKRKQRAKCVRKSNQQTCANNDEKPDDSSDDSDNDDDNDEMSQVKGENEENVTVATAEEKHNGPTMHKDDAVTVNENITSTGTTDDNTEVMTSPDDVTENSSFKKDETDDIRPTEQQEVKIPEVQENTADDEMKSERDVKTPIKENTDKNELEKNSPNSADNKEN